jgi:hypothetical protein
MSLSPTATVAPRLGRAPSSCPGAVLPLGSVGPYGTLMGREPAWAGVYAELDRTASVFRASDAPHTEHGWRVKVLWVMHPDARATVTVTGSAVGGDEALWFEPAGKTPTTTLVLDPSAPGTVDDIWLNWPSYLYVPRAGCYRLDVTSANGGWSATFGFGA